MQPLNPVLLSATIAHFTRSNKSFFHTSCAIPESTWLQRTGSAGCLQAGRAAERRSGRRHLGYSWRADVRSRRFTLPKRTYNL